MEVAVYVYGPSMLEPHVAAGYGPCIYMDSPKSDTGQKESATVHMLRVPHSCTVAQLCEAILFDLVKVKQPKDDQASDRTVPLFRPPVFISQSRNPRSHSEAGGTRPWDITTPLILRKLGSNDILNTRSNIRQQISDMGQQIYCVTGLTPEFPAWKDICGNLSGNDFEEKKEKDIFTFLKSPFSPWPLAASDAVELKAKILQKNEGTLKPANMNSPLEQAVNNRMIEEMMIKQENLEAILSQAIQHVRQLEDTNRLLRAQSTEANQKLARKIHDHAQLTEFVQTQITPSSKTPLLGRSEHPGNTEAGGGGGETLKLQQILVSRQAEVLSQVERLQSDLSLAVLALREVLNLLALMVQKVQILTSRAPARRDNQLPSARAFSFRAATKHHFRYNRKCVGLHCTQIHLH